MKESDMLEKGVTKNNIQETLKLSIAEYKELDGIWEKLEIHIELLNNKFIAC